MGDVIFRVQEGLFMSSERIELIFSSGDRRNDKGFLGSDAEG